MSPALFELTEVCKVYRVGEVELQALTDVSLRIDAGEYVSVVGASGSGKSTFLHLLGLLDRPSSGSYRLGGEDVGNLSERELAGIRNRRIGFVFQAFNLLPRTTVVENVILPLEYAGMAARERVPRARELLDRVGLGTHQHRHPNQLSGGQQQRVAIARALATAPSAILADEPTGNLDSRSAGEILQIFQQLHEAGHTIVLVTHDLQVAAHARRRITFRDGLVVADGEVAA